MARIAGHTTNSFSHVTLVTLEATSLQDKSALFRGNAVFQDRRARHCFRIYFSWDAESPQCLWERRNDSSIFKCFCVFLVAGWVCPVYLNFTGEKEEPLVWTPLRDCKLHISNSIGVPHVMYFCVGLVWYRKQRLLVNHEITLTLVKKPSIFLTHAIFPD